jgi:hypothetical protein
MNFTDERRGPSYLSTTESEDAMSLRQCTLLPTKFANVMNLTHERRDPSYLSTRESEDTWSLRKCLPLPSKLANVINFTQEQGQENQCQTPGLKFKKKNWN